MCHLINYLSSSEAEDLPPHELYSSNLIKQEHYAAIVVSAIVRSAIFYNYSVYIGSAHWFDGASYILYIAG